MTLPEPIKVKAAAGIYYECPLCMYYTYSRATMANHISKCILKLPRERSSDMKENKTPNQTSADKDIESPDSSLAGWTELSRQLTKSRQTESRKTDRIRTESGQQTDTGHDFPENPDKNETRAEHGQCCPLTFASNELMELIPAEIRQHFVPRKRLIKCLFGYLKSF